MGFTYLFENAKTFQNKDTCHFRFSEIAISQSVLALFTLYSAHENHVFCFVCPQSPFNVFLLTSVAVLPFFPPLSRCAIPTYK